MYPWLRAVMSHRWQLNTNEAGLCTNKIQHLSHHATGNIYSDTVSTACSMDIQNLKLRPLLRLKTLNIKNHNLDRPESNNRLRILLLLETWCLANSLILLVYVGLLITAMPRAQPQANCQHKWQHPIIFHSDRHLQSWDPDKPGATGIERRKLQRMLTEW